MHQNSEEFEFDFADMELLNALDDETLKQIIKANFTEIDYEVYVDPNQVLDYADNMTSDGFNCTETVWNVTLIPRSLRTNDYYKMVRVGYIAFLPQSHFE